MKDWTALAKASGLDIPAKEVAKNTPPLDGLEEVFRPLAKSLTAEMEPAAIFHADLEQA